MPHIDLPSEFATSYRNSEKYPRRVVLRETYGASLLKLIRERLEERALELFVASPKTFITVKDILADGRPDQQNLFSDSEIKTWLGDTSEPDPADATRLSGELATKPDPRCRFV
jgi:hypothetical protein